MLVVIYRQLRKRFAAVVIQCVNKPRRLGKLARASVAFHPGQRCAIGVFANLTVEINAGPALKFGKPCADSAVVKTSV